MRSFWQFFPSWGHALLKTDTKKPDKHREPIVPPAWRGLYVAALFERDEVRMQSRIAEAKNALAVRAHELFQTTEDHLQEQSAIDEAFQALHALEQCAGHLCLRRR